MSAAPVLDVGCGTSKVPGAVGLDRAAVPGVDVVHDLEETPYPFRDNAFCEVHLNHVLEHVSNPVELLDELWRICQPGATLHLKLPHFSSFLAWADPTHKRAFSYRTFDYFTPESSYAYYSRGRFEVISRRLLYFLPYPQPHDRWLKPLHPIGHLLERLANAHPYIAERFWCYWVGGFDELRVQLRVAK